MYIRKGFLYMGHTMLKHVHLIYLISVYRYIV